MLLVSWFFAALLILLCITGLSSEIRAQSVSILKSLPIQADEWENPDQFLKIFPKKLIYSHHTDFYRCISCEESNVYSLAEQMPEFPGGFEAISSYFKNNLQYPLEAVKAKVQGTVYVGFVVEKDGTPSQIQVLKGISYGWDEEACRLIAGMPKWKPGMQSGKPVPVRYSLPVKFTLPASPKK